MEQPESHKKKRSGEFTWSSKQELIDYFKKKYNIEEEMLEREIADATRRFKPRKGEPLNVKELWQKTGTLLERHFSVSYGTDTEQS